MIKHFQRLFAAGYLAIVVLFLCCGLALVVSATVELWHGIDWRETRTVRERFNAVLECVGLLTIAVAAFELGQTILEEEIIRAAHMSAPTRARRFLSRFMIVVVVSLAIECLVSVFQLTHANPALLPQAAMIGFAAAALLVAWGVFVKLNKSVEEIEPEAMAAAKREDRKME